MLSTLYTAMCPISTSDPSAQVAKTSLLGVILLQEAWGGARPAPLEVLSMPTSSVPPLQEDEGWAWSANTPLWVSLAGRMAPRGREAIPPSGEWGALPILPRGVQSAQEHQLLPRACGFCVTDAHPCAL